MHDDTATLDAPPSAFDERAPLHLSFLLPSLFALAGQALQPGQEERQLASVIHQLYWSEKARRKLLADPEAFIMGLKVLPRVKAVLSMMQATLLAGRLTTPEFSWWWGGRDPDPQTGSDDPLAGSAGLPAEMPQVVLYATVI